MGEDHRRHKRTAGLSPAVDPGLVEKLRLVVAGRLGQQFDTPYFGSTPDFAVMREFWTEMAKTDPRSRLTDLLAYEQSDLAGSVGKLRTPALVLHGSADQICSAAQADALASSIPGAVLERIEGAGNIVHLEQPEATHQTIERFLAGLAPAGTASK